ncbi:MAG: YhbY family RNA-binding protein [Thermoplasmata archaeon]|nr:MAG: YhbY family RNA-binding protein [Thermoplasmata archaeon]
MDNDQRRRLRTEGQGLDATVHVGKDGLTEGVEAELDAQLKRHHLVKVRIQRTAIAEGPGSKDAQARELAERLGAELVERRGHTVLLYRRRAPR